VDVFTIRRLLGNPVAVVLDAENLDTETMQAIARWINLFETTFLLPPTTVKADYRLLIFTPLGELGCCAFDLPMSVKRITADIGIKKYDRRFWVAMLIYT
jgi:PhzF family phenazine biosynthesis protein